VDTAVPKVEGQVIKVTRGGNLQEALNRSNPGDEINLEDGAEFTGNFVLPAKSGGHAGQAIRWITITSQSSGLPGPGIRVDPSSSKSMAKILSTNAAPALAAAPGAGGFRLIGIEISVAPGVKTSYGAVRLGEGKESSLEQLPHDIIIDRCYVHGIPAGNMRRGIALNSARSAVINSWVSDCHEVGADSQAICSWNGPGPFEISNNYLEAAGENVMFGGADPSIQGLIPSDIEFKDNYCRKLLSWRLGDPGYAGTRWGVKNLFEVKNAQRVLVENNVFENNWLDAQTGYAILFKSVDQEGHAPWCIAKDITFRNNVVRHVSSALNVQGKDPDQQSGRTGNITIDHNLFEDVDGKKWGGEGTFIKITDTGAVTLDHNTVLNRGSIIIAYGPPSGPFAFTNNIVYNNAYGIKGDGTASGTSTLQRYFKPFTVAGNAIVGGKSSEYPSGNCLQPASTAPATLEGGHLYSQCHGTDGGTIGCDVNAIGRIEQREKLSGE
ncbi:MAG TPA: right-handed parallel beta-helix repeat-containing protein, partial [Blastocatellia bacterium]